MNKRIKIPGRTWFYLFSVLLLAICASWIWFSRNKPEEAIAGPISAPRRGFQAPAFSLKSNTGEEVSFKTQADKVYMINFWTSWCPPCRAEMPAIQRVYSDYQDDGLVVLAINATDQDRITAVNSFVTENQLEFPILLDTDGEVSRLYNLQALPTTFFIDQNGIIQDVVLGGPMAEALLRTRIEGLLEGLK